MAKRAIRLISIACVLFFGVSIVGIGDLKTSAHGGCSMESCDGQPRYTKCVKQYGFPAVSFCNGKTQTAIDQVKSCFQVTACEAAYQPWVD